MEFFAYLDPGSGSLFIQAILGLVLAGGLFFRRITHRVSQLFHKVTKRQVAKNEKPAEDK